MSYILTNHNVQGNTPSATAPSATFTNSHGARAGHLLIAGFYCNGGGTGAFPTPNGWSLAQSYWGGTNTDSLAIFYKVAAGGETSVASTIGGSTNSWAGIYEFAGVSSTIIANATPAAVALGTGSLKSNAFTPKVGDLIFMLFGGTGALSAESWTSSASLSITTPTNESNYVDGYATANSGSSQTVTFNWTGTSNATVLAVSFNNNQPIWPGNLSILGVG